MTLNVWNIIECIISAIICFPSMKISHVAFVMNQDGELLVYKNKGRPAKEESESTRVNSNLRKELNKLKKEMRYQDGTDIFLPSPLLLTK